MSESRIGRPVGSVFFQYSLLFITGIIIWQIFHPALMTSDSLHQYAQAKTGFFDDWHPPLMSIVLSGVMKLGGDISSLSLVQCLAALFGLRSALSLLIIFFSDGKVTARHAGLAGTILTIPFLIPFLTPYMLYSVIFWKDAWLAIASLWVISYILWLFLYQESLQRRSFTLHIMLMSLISAILVLMRHNAVVMLPAICVILAILSARKLGRIGLAIFALPLILGFVLGPALNSFFDVTRTYTGNTILASDLSVMLRIYPHLDPEFPLTARRKNSPVFLIADNGGVWNETLEGAPCPYMNKKSCNQDFPLSCFGTYENTFNIDGNNCYMPPRSDNKLLKEEYYKAVTTQPLNLMKTKIRLYWWMLRPSEWQYFEVSCQIDKNEFGLKLNDRFAQPRETLCYLSHEVANKWYFNWVTGIHLLWLTLNFLLAIYFAIKSFFKRDVRTVTAWLLFLMPLSYYLSYLIAANTQDTRYMYPSTLMMQVLVVSLITSKILGARFAQKSDKGISKTY